MSDPFALQARALHGLQTLSIDATTGALQQAPAPSLMKEQAGIWQQSIRATFSDPTSPQHYVPHRILNQHNADRARPFKSKINGPTKVLLEIFSRWQIADADAGVLLGGHSSVYIERLRNGTAGLIERDTKDRARLIIVIYEGVHSLLRTPEAEQSWIRAEHAALGNQSLLDVMLCGSILDLARGKAFVQYANGR